MPEVNPVQGQDFASVGRLCRAIAIGKYKIVASSKSGIEPPEQIEARENRQDGQIGRTPGARVRRDILLFKLERYLLNKRLPGDYSIQTFLHALASGELAIVRDKEHAKKIDARKKADICQVCGDGRKDNGEYCMPCRIWVQPGDPLGLDLAA